MKIERASSMGFCFGVKNAVDNASDTVKSASAKNKRVYACGPIIHNKHVISELENEGLITVRSIEDIPDGEMVIVRSHGESKAFYDRANDKNLDIIDTTCPNVKKIHNLVKKAHQDGHNILIIGNRHHPEIEAINGWADEDAEIIETVDDIDKLEKRNYFVVVQTTFNEKNFLDIEKKLREKHSDVIIKNTICSATFDRQRACAELAKKTDMMIVVGDKSSSNTKKLYEIAKKYCKSTVFVENIEDLPLKHISNYNTIGIAAGASTPERIIKEVIARMSEVKTDNMEIHPMEEYMDEIDKTMRLPRTGDTITGEIIQISDDEIIVNIKCKKDGIIPKDEVKLEEGKSLTEQFKEGDEVQAKVLKNDDGDGNILLSNKRVINYEHFDEINQALEDKTPLEVKVTRVVNGGVIANYNDISGFIPLSQLSDRYVEKADEFVGQTLTVKVTRVDQKRNKVVFSHKAVLNEERQKKLEEIWDALSEGDVIQGKVMRFTDYGAFVDIGGIDGLLHISEISWGKLRHPEEVLSINEEIQVKILSMNKEKEKISLGYKQNQPEPWTIINNKYQEGQVITGKAVQLKEYGVFVELEPGLDGLVHISEIAHKRVNDISEEIEVGQEITAKILEIDPERKRISLSIKETIEKPEEDEVETDQEEADEAADTEEREPDASMEPFDKPVDADAEDEKVAEEAQEIAASEPVEAEEAAAEQPEKEDDGEKLEDY